MAFAQVLREPLSIEPSYVDFVELYFERGWTDGLPIIPPTDEAVDAIKLALANGNVCVRGAV